MLFVPLRTVDSVDYCLTQLLWRERFQVLIRRTIAFAKTRLGWCAIKIAVCWWIVLWVRSISRGHEYDGEAGRVVVPRFSCFRACGNRWSWFLVSVPLGSWVLCLRSCLPDAPPLLGCGCEKEGGARMSTPLWGLWAAVSYSPTPYRVQYHQRVAGLATGFGMGPGFSPQP